MSKKLKYGYIAFAISFVVPDFSLEYVGIAMAAASVIGGVSMLLESLQSAVIGSFMLSQFFLNFGILPGIEVKKGMRIAMSVWPWTAAFIPQLTPENRIFFLLTIPPYLIWAASITYLNIVKLKDQQNQSVQTTRASARV